MNDLPDVIMLTYFTDLVMRLFKQRLLSIPMLGFDH